jgi:hypothetical protein
MSHDGIANASPAAARSSVREYLPGIHHSAEGGNNFEAAAVAVQARRTVVLDENTPAPSGLFGSGDMKSMLTRTTKGLPPRWELYWRMAGPRALAILRMASAAVVSMALLFTVLYSMVPGSLIYEPAPLALGRVTTPIAPQGAAGLGCRFFFCLSVVMTGVPLACNVVVAQTSFFAVVLFHLLSLTSLVLRMLLTMYLFYIFSASPVSVVLSRWCILSSRSLTGLRSFEFRILNEFGFDRELLDAEVTVTLSLTPSRNPSKRRFYELSLLRAKQPIMPVRGMGMGGGWDLGCDYGLNEI